MSGSVTVDGALDADSITLKAEDIREAIGLGKDQFIPPLACKLRFVNKCKSNPKNQVASFMPCPFQLFACVLLPKTPLMDTTRPSIHISRQHHALL